MLLVDSILLLSPFVQTSLLAEEKVIPQVSKMCVARLVGARVEEDRKVLEDLPTLVAATERVKAEDAQEARDGPSSSQVCFKCGSNDHWARDCPKMDVGPSNLKKRNLGAHAYGAWTCSNPDNSLDEKCSLNLFQVDSLCGTAVSPVQDDDDYEAHAAFLVESEEFGLLDCGATTSFGSVEGAEALFSKSHEHDTRFPEDDPFGGRSFNFGDGDSSKATSLSRLPVRNDALGDFWIPVHLFVDQPML